MSQKIPQETTSIYFNSIVRNDVKPLSVDDLPAEVVEEFNRNVRLAFYGEDADAVTRRIRYLIPYILQSIDWDAYGLPLEAWQLQYYYRRERFIEKTRLTFERFMDHGPLVQAVEALGLEPEPTFEFILFLNYYFGLRSELRYSAVEQLAQAQEALRNLEGGERRERGEKVSLDIQVGGRHFRFSNAGFIREAIGMIDRERLQSGAFVNDFTEGAARDKLRAIDYYTVRTLLDYLPIAKRNRRRGQFTQAERNFGLSVLSFCGRLPDTDREGECSRENNATFDKLMRDFRGARIPFAMELFL